LLYFKRFVEMGVELVVEIDQKNTVIPWQTIVLVDNIQPDTKL
tara:strand:+ start:1320 stop:1448 length:129 start_codon:yes stop_codon:yes gene_type:complete